MKLQKARELIENARKQPMEVVDWIDHHPAGSHFRSRVTGARFHLVGSDNDDFPVHIIKVDKNGTPDLIHSFDERSLDWSDNKLQTETKRILHGMYAL